MYTKNTDVLQLVVFLTSEGVFLHFPHVVSTPARSGKLEAHSVNTICSLINVNEPTNEILAESEIEHVLSLNVTRTDYQQERSMTVDNLRKLIEISFNLLSEHMQLGFSYI